MTRVGIQPTISVFQRANTVHASDRAATVIGSSYQLLAIKYAVSYRGIFKRMPKYSGTREFRTNCKQLRTSLMIAMIRCCNALTIYVLPKFRFTFN
jgi:hypothetical protein